MTSVTLRVGFAGVRCFELGSVPQGRSRRRFIFPRKVSTEQCKATRQTGTLPKTRRTGCDQALCRNAECSALSAASAGGTEILRGRLRAETQNISANGVLFAMDRDVPVGSLVDFTILLPGQVVGSRCDVQIDCHGRVVRSFEDNGRRGVGVVIDEYHFERA